MAVGQAAEARHQRVPAQEAQRRALFGLRAVASLRRAVKGALSIQFVPQALTSYGGPELLQRYLWQINLVVRLRRAFAGPRSDHGRRERRAGAVSSSAREVDEPVMRLMGPSHGGSSAGVGGREPAREGDPEMRARTVQGVALVTLVLVLLTGCAQIGQNPKTAMGGLGGAAVGGLIAAAAGGGGTGIAAGVIGGGLLGGLVGNLLDDRDRRLAAEAANRALETAPSGRSVAWRNPDSGHAGTVTPVRTYQAPGGTYCREYQTAVTIEGRQERGYGTACRQPDGTWKIVN
jgi:surface antigen